VFIIENINIFGSPYTPQFGGWAFMKDRGKLAPYWSQIPTSTDILVTHGPPKGVLDLSYSRDDILEYCGDKELYNEVLRVQPKHMIFGHIHNFKDCYNSGIKKISDISTIFHNVSCITDRKFELGLTSKGQIIEY
jgi:Icc-related predicted phosphoesterase